MRKKTKREVSRLPGNQVLFSSSSPGTTTLLHFNACLTTPFIKSKSRMQGTKKARYH